MKWSPFIRFVQQGLSTALLVLPFDLTAQEFSLLEAINRALEHNRNLELSRLSARGAEIRMDDAASLFLPTLLPSIETGGTGEGFRTEYRLAVSEQTAWGTSVEMEGVVSREDPETQGSLYLGRITLTLRQPLLRRVGILSNREPLSRAESGYAAALRRWEQQKADIVLRVVELHEQMLRSQRELQCARDAVQRLDQLLRLTAIRERQGRASRIDTLRAESRLGNERLRLAGLEEQHRTLVASFADLLGLPPNAVPSAIAGPRFELDDVDESTALKAAFSNRMDFAQALHDRVDADRSVRIARREMWPDVHLVSRYEQRGLGSSWVDATGLGDDSWFVGLTLSTTLPLRHARYSLQDAVFSREAADVRVEALASTIRREVLQALSAHRRALTQLPLAAKNHSLARDRVVLARRLFEVGKGDSFTVADAEEELQRAEENLLAAQAEESIAACRLLYVTGTLIQHPENLKPAAVEGWTCRSRW